MAPAKGRASPFPMPNLWENEKVFSFPVSLWRPGKKQLSVLVGCCSQVQCHEDARAEITCSK